MDSATENVIGKICCIKEKLLSYCECEAAKGKEEFDCEAMGETVDMVKDLAEAEEKIIKAKYYECLTKQLKRREIEDMIESPMDFAEEDWDDLEEMLDRFGYRRNGRMMNDGSKGSNGRSTRSSRANNQSRGANGRFNYVPMNDMDYRDMNESTMRDYQDGMMQNRSKMDDFRDMRRHYHETHKEEDKRRMEEREMEAIEETLGSMKELIADANPMHKQKLEANLQNLMTELKRS